VKVFRILIFALAAWGTALRLTDDTLVALGAGTACIWLGIIIYDAAGKW
jgi:hypothetical protein